MELNRDQIVKALECISRTGDVLCDGCPYRKYDGLACHRIGALNALALIRELTEENERLQKNVEELIVTLKMNDAPYPEGLQIVHDFFEKGKRAAEVDSARRMQARLKEQAEKIGFPYDDVVVSVRTIDRIANEMLEEQE